MLVNGSLGELRALKPYSTANFTVSTFPCNVYATSGCSAATVVRCLLCNYNDSTSSGDGRRTAKCPTGFASRSLKVLTVCVVVAVWCVVDLKALSV